MNESNQIEKEVIGSQVQVETLIFRLPKKNHDAMVQLFKQSTDLFRKHGVLRWGYYQLNRNENNMEFTDLAKTILAGQDEEVWMEIFTYKDSKHKEEVRAKMMNDESCGKGYQQFLDLITHGSNVILGGFSRLDGIDFV